MYCDTIIFFVVVKYDLKIILKDPYFSCWF
ncbi:MAG: hypothetical protein RIR48_803 [Bacteroidota bacterium]